MSSDSEQEPRLPNPEVPDKVEDLNANESTENISNEQSSSSEKEDSIQEDLQETPEIEPEVPQKKKRGKKKDKKSKSSKEQKKPTKNQDKKEADRIQENAEKEQEQRADKEWVKMDKVPEKDEILNTALTEQSEEQGGKAKKKEVDPDIDTEKQAVFENMWNKAIQESQRANNTPKPKSQNDRPGSNSSKSLGKRNEKEEISPRNPPPSVTRRFLGHILQALLDLTHTNSTAFAVNLLWHSAAVYYLILRPRKALLANAVVSGGKSGVPHFAIDTVKFLGGVHAAWALLSLLSFKIKDSTAQKAILLAFTLANFSHLYFNLSALASGRWRIWFTKITAGSSLVTLVNIACYLASVKKNGRYL